MNCRMCSLPLLTSTSEPMTEMTTALLNGDIKNGGSQRF